MTLPQLNAKKFTLVLVVVGIVVTVVLLLVAVFSRKRVVEVTLPPAGPIEIPEPTTIPIGGPILPPAETAPSAPTIPVPSTEQTLPLSRFHILSSGIFGGATVGYNREDGTLFRLDANGFPILLTDDRFPFASQVTWASDRSKAILEFPDGANILYNLQTKRPVTLPKHWQEFSFSPSGDAIVFKSLGFDPDNQWLAVANPDGSNVVPLEQLGDRGHLVQPLWSPDSRVVALYTKPVDQTRQTLFFIGPNHENLPSTVIEGLNFLGRWDPDGSRLLYSTATRETAWRPTLWLVNGSGQLLGGNRTPLDIQTWADKCVFRGTTSLVCAVPQQLPDGAGLVRLGVPATTDRLIELNLQSQVKRDILTDRPISADTLTLSPDGKTLFINDRVDGKVKKIPL